MPMVGAKDQGRFNLVATEFGDYPVWRFCKGQFAGGVANVATGGGVESGGFEDSRY